MNRVRPPAILVTIAATIGALAFTAILTFFSGKVSVDYGSFRVDGRPRNYRVVIPPRTAGERLPVIFHFHGHGNTPESEADRTKLDQLAAARRIVLVYPAAIEGNWRTRATDSAAPNENLDVRFFDALLDHLVERFEVDHSRVYVTGMSMGAEFAYELAMARSQKIAAVAACSACASGEIHSERPIPVMMVVGEKEATLLEVAREDAIEYRRQGHVCEVLVNHGRGHEWAPDRNMRMWRFLAKYQLGH